MDRRAEVLLAVGAALASQHPIGDALKTRLRDGLTRDPIDSTLATVLLGGQLFLKAERGHNPKINSLSDALMFVGSAMNGFSASPPHTEAGKLIATALMTVGPALSAQGLAVPRAEAAKVERESLDTQKQILAKLEAILDALEKQKA